MNNIAAQLVQSKMAEVAARVSGRLSTVSSETGIDFGSSFADALLSATSQTSHQTDAATELAVAKAKAQLLGLNASDDDVNSILDSANKGISGNGSTAALPSDRITTITGKEIAMNSSGQLGYQPLTTNVPYKDIIDEVAQRYGINPALICAVIEAESDFNPNCVSSAGAVGLMQLMPETAEGVGVPVGQRTDPTLNIDGATRYILAQITRFDGDVKTALAAYNCGPYGLARRGVSDVDDPEQFVKMPKETQNYVRKLEKLVAKYGFEGMLDQNFYA